jgi:hypothetical protein
MIGRVPQVPGFPLIAGFRANDNGYMTGPNCRASAPVVPKYVPGVSYFHV